MRQSWIMGCRTYYLWEVHSLMSDWHSIRRSCRAQVCRVLKLETGESTDSLPNRSVRRKCVELLNLYVVDKVRGLDTWDTYYQGIGFRILGLVGEGSHDSSEGCGVAFPARELGVVALWEAGYKDR